MQPAPIPTPTDQVTAHRVAVKSWDRSLPGREPGNELALVPVEKLPFTGGAPTILAENKTVMALAAPAGLPSNLADPNSEAITAIAAASPTGLDTMLTANRSVPELIAPSFDAPRAAPPMGTDFASTSPPNSLVAPTITRERKAETPAYAKASMPRPNVQELAATASDDLTIQHQDNRPIEVARGAAQALIGYRATDPVFAAQRRGPRDPSENAGENSDRLAATMSDRAEDSTVNAARDTLRQPEGGADVSAAQVDVRTTAEGTRVTTRPIGSLALPADQPVTSDTARETAMAGPERSDVPSALDSGRETDPMVAVRRNFDARRLIVTEVSQEAALRRVRVSGQLDAPKISRSPAEVLLKIDGSRRALASARRPAQSAPRSIARAGRLAWSSAPDETHPQVVALHDLPERSETTPLSPKAGSQDPIMIAAVRAGETGWMYAQTRRADGERALAGPAVPGAERPVEVGQKDIALRRDRLANVGEVNSSADSILSDGAAVSPVVVLEGALRNRAGDASPVTGRESKPLPKLAAISPEIRADDAPASVSKLPSVGPQPATRVLLFVYVDDPRQTKRPGKGDPWSAELPPDIQSAVWASRVTSVTEIVQVQNWCDGGSGDAGRAWLSDKIRLLQVRVDIDPGRVADFERALPVFGGQPGGFFHNRLPLIGGQAGDPVEQRAKAFLGEMSGGLFFDHADGVTSAMKKAGCTSVVWNGGDGPSTSLGSQLAARFGN